MFCGGLSITLCIKSKFKVLANDLNEYVIDLYNEILFNKCENIKKVWYTWISRENIF